MEGAFPGLSPAGRRFARMGSVEGRGVRPRGVSLASVGALVFGSAEIPTENAHLSALRRISFAGKTYEKEWENVAKWRRCDWPGSFASPFAIVGELSVFFFRDKMGNLEIVESLSPLSLICRERRHGVFLTCNASKKQKEAEYSQLRHNIAWCPWQGTIRDTPNFPESAGGLPWPSI